MKQFIISILLLLSVTPAFSVKFSIEEIQYHANCKGHVKSIKEIDGNTTTISYYDENGRFLHSDQLLDGKKKTVSSIKYDKYGFPVEYNSYGSITVLKYNDQHQLIAIENRDIGKRIYS